jgi:uncharacterized protein (DUF2141 family)
MLLHLGGLPAAVKPEAKTDLVINVLDVKDTVHDIYVAVSRQSSGFPDRPDVVKYYKLSPTVRNTASLSVHDLPYGEYAIMLFQDMNGNMKLDKGFMGIPSEPFAFSNNFRPVFGPPKWKDCEFDYNQNSNRVNITHLIKMLR